MSKQRLHAIFTVMLVAALLYLSLSACGSSSYLKVSDGVATFDLKKAYGDKYDLPREFNVQKTVGKKLNNMKQPVHSLIILNGDTGFEKLFEHLVPIAESITEIEIPTGRNFGRLPLTPFKNLQVLRITSLWLPDDDEADKFMNGLRQFPQLRELTIQPSGKGVYAFYSSLKSSELALTIDGRTIDEWDPSRNMDKVDRYEFMVGGLMETITKEIDSYTESSEPPPNINGKILIAKKNESQSTDFLSPNGSLAKQYFAQTIDECAAVLIIHAKFVASGQYSDNTGKNTGTAYKVIYTIQVIDFVNKVKYSPVPFITTKPPNTMISGGGSNSSGYNGYSDGELWNVLDKMVTIK